MPTSPLDIERWVPRRFDQIVGCNAVKEFFHELLAGPEVGGNTLIIGPSGTGKTACVKNYVRSLMCANRDAIAASSCGECSSCREFDERYEEAGLFAEFHDRSWVSGRVPVHFFPVNCGEINEVDFKKLIRNVESFAGHRVVFLDEVHRLRRQRVDEMLLIPLRQLRAMFVGATTKPGELDEMFLNRFGTKLTTTKPRPDELATFIHERCKEWGLQIDTDETVATLVRRSHRVVANAISALARAAAKRPPILTRSMVESFEFYADEIDDTSGDAAA